MNTQLTEKLKHYSGNATVGLYLIGEGVYNERMAATLKDGIEFCNSVGAARETLRDIPGALGKLEQLSSINYELEQVRSILASGKSPKEISPETIQDLEKYFSGFHDLLKEDELAKVIPIAEGVTEKVRMRKAV